MNNKYFYVPFVVNRKLSLEIMSLALFTHRSIMSYPWRKTKKPKKASKPSALSQKYFEHPAFLSRTSVPIQLQAYCNRVLQMARLGRKEEVLRMFLVLFDERADPSGRMTVQTIAELFDVLFIQMCCTDSEERKKWRQYVKKHLKPRRVWLKTPAFTRDPTAKDDVQEDADETS